jgi:hypothetical protein
MLCPKTGSNASNYIQITFFTTKSIQTTKDHHRSECISNNLNHFAGIFKGTSRISKSALLPLSQAAKPVVRKLSEVHEVDYIVRIYV